MHATTIGEDEVAALCRVHAAAAAEANDEVCAKLSRHFHAGINILGARVFPHVAKDLDRQADLPHKTCRTLGIARFHDAWIIHHQHARAAILTRQLAHAGKRAITIDEPRTRLVIEGGE